MKGEEEERREGESGVAIKILGAIGAEAQLALAMAGEVATDRSISYQNLLQFSPQKTKFIFEKKNPNETVGRVWLCEIPDGPIVAQQI